jgi:hypothetical protein
MGINLLVSWLRSLFYYQRNFSEFKKKKREGLWDYCEFIWGMREKEKSKYY